MWFEEWKNKKQKRDRQRRTETRGNLIESLPEGYGENKRSVTFSVPAYKYCRGLTIISVYTNLSRLLVSYSCGSQLSDQDSSHES